MKLTRWMMLQDWMTGRRLARGGRVTALLAAPAGMTVTGTSWMTGERATETVPVLALALTRDGRPLPMVAAGGDLNHATCGLLPAGVMYETYEMGT